MPALASVTIPRFGSSSSQGKSATHCKPLPWLDANRRLYGEDPLPVKLSDEAKVSGKIVSRILGDNGAYYDIKIGEVMLNDISVSEILEYVTPQHLEDYENEQFVEEEELLRIAEAKEKRREYEERQRKKERAKMKGIAGYAAPVQEPSAEDEAQEAEVATGRHGRARPTYSHLFKIPLERQRRKRDPETGELLPLGSGQMAQGNTMESSQDDEQMPDVPGQPSHFESDLPKRRRRKRDPITGELLPLGPVAGRNTEADEAFAGPITDIGKKRRRRRRHPITNGLMPFGWRYDPEAEKASGIVGARSADVVAMSPAMHRLSIVQDHQAKRVKLDNKSLSGRSNSGQVVLPSPAKNAGEESSGSEEDEDNVATFSRRASGYGMLASSAGRPAHNTPQKSLPSAAHGMLASAAMIQSTDATSDSESSPKPVSVRKTSTSRPVMGTDPAGKANTEADEEELVDGEWIIESILAHHMSDPRTHTPNLGKEPVMLYKVKWEGFDEPTWEPIESFPDQGIVEDYHVYVAQQNSLADTTTTTQHNNPALEETRRTASATPNMGKRTMSAGLSKATSLATTPATQSNDDDENESSEEEEDDEEDDEDDDDGSYEVEAVLAHHMSDPKSHGPEFGRQPVMLYQVKWKGYDNTTWEPISSFVDRSVVKKYRSKAGLGNRASEVSSARKEQQGVAMR